jgi:hypothetical protein
MKAYRGVEVQIHVFLSSALDGDECSASHTGLCAPEERVPDFHWIGDRVGLRNRLDAVEKLNFFAENRTSISSPSRYQPVSVLPMLSRFLSVIMIKKVKM